MPNVMVALPNIAGAPVQRHKGLNMEGPPPTSVRSVVPLVCGVGQVNFESYNVGCMAANDSLFGSRGRFSGVKIQ